MGATITQRELRNESAAIMDRVEAGERFTVTRNGRPIAELVPITGPRVFVPTAEVAAAMAHLPRIDYQQMRREADEWFGDDGDRI
jgi:prevent-host-death family protein